MLTAASQNRQSNNSNGWSKDQLPLYLFIAGVLHGLRTQHTPRASLKSGLAADKLADTVLLTEHIPRILALVCIKLTVAIDLSAAHLQSPMVK